MAPVPRKKVFDAYWKFAGARQAIFHRRAAGFPAPWTDDPVLQRHKFCNVYRASDRVSQFLIRDVIYSEHAQDFAPEDAFLRIVWFRLFSKESTWQALEQTNGALTRRNFNTDRLARQLDAMKQRRSIYTAAFILCANKAYGQSSKHRNHLALLEHMFIRGDLGRQLARARSLADIYEALLSYPLMGPFMAYQTAVDLNYSPHLNFSEDDWVVPGPGAIRGLHKVFSDFGGLAPQQLIMSMVDRQEEEFDRLGIQFQDLFGRRLHAVDCQGLFCETDKLSRVLFPELKSNRVRIKQEFRQHAEPLELFYPPKWGINERLVELGYRQPPQQSQLTLDQAKLKLAATVPSEPSAATHHEGSTDAPDQLAFATG
jgi:hypothetical protein